MIRTVLALLLLLFAAVPAAAQVRLSFHSREFGNTFPHAFVTFEGTLSDGTPVPLTGYGFTARTLSPAILMGSVDGRVEDITGAELRRGTNHFTVTVDDAGYGRMLAVVEDWRGRGPKSYNLNRANCIHFVMEIAEAVGLRVNEETRFIKRPRAFTQELLSLNTGRPDVVAAAAEAAPTTP